MTKETMVETGNEEFSGASLDVIEVPDEDLTILTDMANPSKDGEEVQPDTEKELEKESDEETAGKKSESGDENQDDEHLSEEDQTKQQKRNLYKTPRNKLVREWHTAHEEAAAQKARAELLEQEVAELKKGQKEAPEPLQTLQDQQKTLIDQCNLAAEDSDLEAYQTARNELDAVNNQIMEMRFNKPVEEEGQTETPDAPGNQEPQAPHPAAQAWMDQNEWFFNPKNDYLAAYAQKIEFQLREEKGMKMGPKLYEELNRQLAEIPGYEDVIGKRAQQSDADEINQDVGKPKPQGKPKHLMAPSRAGNGPTKPKPGELTQYDIQTMKRAKLDPNNPDHKAAYLKYKR
jgi:hypothetical protein